MTIAHWISQGRLYRKKTDKKQLEGQNVKHGKEQKQFTTSNKSYQD